MKRFLAILSLLFTFTFAFADEYGFALWDWNTNNKTILQYFLSNGWSVSVDEEDNFYHFRPVKDDFYYNNKLLKVAEFFCSFKSDGTLSSQNIYIDRNFSLSTALFTLLSIATDDNALLYQHDYPKEPYSTFTYHAHLKECDSTYVIAGQNDDYILMLSYDVLEK